VAKPHGSFHVRDVDQTQMGSMGMDGERPRREGYHVWARDFSSRSKVPRSQCPISPITNKQNLRAAPALRETLTRFIRGVLH